MLFAGPPFRFLLGESPDYRARDVSQGLTPFQVVAS
jgi:hypothetical protein